MDAYVHNFDGREKLIVSKSLFRIISQNTIENGTFDLVIASNSTNEQVTVNSNDLSFREEL